MKKLLLLVPLLVLISCSVQKRKYNKGFYVNWHSKEHKERTAAVDPAKHTHTVREQASVPQPAEQVFKSRTLVEAQSTSQGLSKNMISTKTPPEDTCDVLVFKDGSEIRSKVLEINAAEVKYKRCDLMSGPTYVSKKSELFMIKYANGTREVIKTEVPETRSPAPVQRPQNSTYNNDRSRQIKQNHPQAMLSLFFGIAALLSLLILSGIGFGPLALLVPLILAIATIIMSRGAMRQIRANPEIWKGKGMAVTGFVFGLVILGFFALVLTIALLLLI